MFTSSTTARGVRSVRRTRRNPTYSESDYARARAGDKNLAGANLKGANLAGADLAGANLFRANLTGANLQDANLENVAFELVRLGNVNLTGANLAGAELYGAHLVSANLTGANLERANLERANLTGANLEGANLTGANLESGKLAHAILTGANLAGANLFRANLTGANLFLANLRNAILAGAFLPDANFTGANLFSANLERANLERANLERANLERATLRNAILTDANLTDANLADANLAGANLQNANLEGANFQGANLTDANLEGAILESVNLKGAEVAGTILERPVTRPARSYGRQTGAVLKMVKADAPSRAAEFKKRFPAEFERLKADTQGRDFTDVLRQQVRQKYVTPFEWIVTEGVYDSAAQRFCPDPNLVFKFNLDLSDPSFTGRQREFLKKLADKSRRSGHPHEKHDLFTVGWVRLCVNDAQQTWLVEEVQSDVGIVRTKLKDGTAPAGLEGYKDVIAELRPYIDRFYEDALGVVFMEAEKRGYSVEMLTYESKQRDGSPRNVYTDLPRAMGMQRQKGSRVLPTRAPDTPMSFSDTRIGEAVAETWYYKPNPRASSRAASGRSTRSSRKRR
jgi:uncharacterized protein YjbI with pentapeptide repeats